MPRDHKYKVHYEEEAGKTLCATTRITKAASDKSKVTCGKCLYILKAQDAPTKPKRRIPF